MRELAPPLGDEGPHLVELEVGGGRGQQLLADDDRPLGHVDAVAPGALGQGRQHAPADVADVGRALAQVGVGDLLEGAW